MRVAHFCDSEPARADGIAASAGLSVDLLRAAGHEVHHFYPSSRGLRSVPLPFRQIRLAMPWARPAPEVDVVHAHSTGPVGMAGFHLARTRDLPLVLTWHTDLVAYAEYFFEIPLGAAHCALQMGLGWTLREHLELTHRGGRRRAQLIVLGRAMMAAAGVVIAPSAKTAVGLSIFGELPPVHTIPTPVVLPPDPTTRAELRAELGLAPEAEVILSVGRVTPEKNPELLLRAFAAVGAERPGARLVIVGVRQRRRPVAALIGELGLAGRVLLVPQVPRERMGGFYRMADVLAFASTTDTQSLVLSEAESLGLPVVVADAALGPRPGRPPSTRLTCEPTPERLAAAICRPLDDQDLRVRTQQAGLQAVYTPADHLALLLDAYRVSRRSHSPRRTGRC